MNAFDALKERGFIEQTTNEEEIRELFEKERVTFYIGFDPTANSLTVGHFLTVMAMATLQRMGHRPIVLMGGGTGMIGDPTGKTDMRRIMTVEEIDNNIECFKKQMSKFIDFSDGNAIIVNNADWLRNLNYIEFLREVGVHFTVNRMLAAECFKTRMEKGLSFLEFNYMLMQAHDFTELYRRYGCKMQFGGNDQWANIIAGVELLRRKEGKTIYGMTFPLLTTSEGKKMGKTEQGAIWLDPERTSPYEFYQYWRNIDDRDVSKCLSLLTFLPMDEVRKLSALEGNEINKAKEVLAYEVTKIVHGEEEAKKSETAAKMLFYGAAEGGSAPETGISKATIEKGMDVLSLLTTCELVPSRGEGRRLIQQGGLKLNDVKISDIEYIIKQDDFKDGILLIQKGKKVFHHAKLV